MPKGMYRGVSLSKELIDAIEQFIEHNKQAGYSSLADFVSDSCRRRLEDLGAMPPTLSLMHINVQEGGNDVVLWDAKLKSSVEVKFSSKEVRCLHCKSIGCYHVHFALELPEVKEEFERRRKLGLQVPDVIT